MVGLHIDAHRRNSLNKIKEGITLNTSLKQHWKILFLKRLTACTVLFVAFALIHCGTGNKDTGASGWVSIFNGKDLTGWTVKITGYEQNDNFGNTFRVEDGSMKVSYDQYDEFNGRFGHIFYKEKLSHYKIRFEYRFTGEQVPGGPEWAFRNSGIMLHCQSPESMTVDQRFPVCVEAQLLGGNGVDERSTGNVCSPGTHIVMDGELVTKHCNQSGSKTYHGDQWVTMEVEVHGGGQIIHRVNGESVMEYEQLQYDETDKDAQKLITGEDKLVKEGYISLQAESHPVEFRNIELLKLNE